MGNSLDRAIAASPRGDSSVLPTIPQDPPSKSTDESRPVPPSPPVPEETGPGSLEQVHNAAREVFPQPFDGAKLVVNKGISQYFQVSHSMSLSQIDPPGYRFGVTYVGRTKYSESEVFPVCLGELHPNGDLNAQIIHQPLNFWRVKYIAQIQGGKMVGQQIVNELRGTSWQTGVTIANPDLLGNRFMCLTDVMKQVTSKFSMGSMFLYQRSPQVPGNQVGMWSLGGRYIGAENKWRFALSASPLQLSGKASFHLRMTDSLQFAAEHETDYSQQSSTTTLGYQYDLARSNLTFKAQMDTNWNVAASFEKKLVPFPFTFALCGIGNQMKSKYSFGIGLIVG